VEVLLVSAAPERERVHAEVVRVSIRIALLAGGVAGFVPGLFVGCLTGAGIAFAAGAVLEWQRQLGFTLGVTPQLLPFGDQAPLLEQISDSWVLVILATGVAVGLLWGLIGTLAFGLLAGLGNQLRRGIPVEVDVDRRPPEERHLPRSPHGRRIR
jgi:hypothetical protein